MRRLPAVVAVLLLAARWPAPAQTSSTSATPSPPSVDERVAKLEAELGRARQDEAARRGAKLFGQACAACHGRDATGDGPGAADLDPRPRDLTARQFRFRTTPNGAHPRPEDLARTIRSGLPGTSMPAFGGLFSDEQVADLIAFVNSKHDLESAGGIPDALALAPVPEATPESVREGHAIYLLAGCWRCHGVRGDGRGPSAKGLTDDAGHRIRPTDFRYAPFKGGRDAASVVRTLRTGLNGTPMPSYDAAMLIAREDTGDTASLEGRLDADAEATIRGFLDASPARAELEGWPDERVAALRDRRMASLAHYVLSLDRRHGFFYRLLRQEPEREARKP